MEVLFSSSPSATVLSGSTTASLSSSTAWFGAVPTIVIVRAVASVVPPWMVAPVQVTTLAAALQVNGPPGPPPSAAETNVTPAGSTSRTETFSAAFVPTFHTLMT